MGKTFRGRSLFTRAGKKFWRPSKSKLKKRLFTGNNESVTKRHELKNEDGIQLSTICKQLKLERLTVKCAKPIREFFVKG